MTTTSKRQRRSTDKAARPGEEIRFALGQSSLGSILVASSEKGVVSILIGGDPDDLIRDLQHRFPKANLVRGDRDDEDLVARVVDYVEAPARGLDLPLDLRGTAFQQRVWQALLEIPAGRTTTFTDVARRTGAPKAMRAVGNACSTDNLTIAVPCHRVLHNDGSLSTGYRRGKDRQHALITGEAEAVSLKRPPSAAHDQ